MAALLDCHRLAFLSHQSKSCAKIWEKYIYSVNDILGVECAKVVDITDDTFKDDVLLPLRLIWQRSEVAILNLLRRTT